MGDQKREDLRFQKAEYRRLLNPEEKINTLTYITKKTDSLTNRFF
jgi:hypothetical protein